MFGVPATGDTARRRGRRAGRQFRNVGHPKSDALRLEPLLDARRAILDACGPWPCGCWDGLLSPAEQPASAKLSQSATRTARPHSSIVLGLCCCSISLIDCSGLSWASVAQPSWPCVRTDALCPDRYSVDSPGSNTPPCANRVQPSYLDVTYGLRDPAGPADCTDCAKRCR